MELLDPTNDCMFKRLFGEAPELLVDLINDLRPDLPDIASVEILKPNIEAKELTGKYFILDVLARDGEGTAIMSKYSGLDHFLQALAGGTHYGQCGPRTGQKGNESHPRAQCRRSD